MTVERFKNEFIEKIIDFEKNKILVDDLENFIRQIDPELIYGQNGLLNNKETVDLGMLADVVQDYGFYKNNGEANLVVKRINDYYVSFLTDK